MAQILIGTCSWTGPGLKGRFYPEGMPSRDWLAYYARHFRLVEVDSTYYRMPSYQHFKLWAERTPPDFVFDVKAFRQMTGHDRDQEPTAELFDQFRAALAPIWESGKLGVVLFQFPPWFRCSTKSLDYLQRCREAMPNHRLAIEFRHGSWLRTGLMDETLRFLRDNELAYVSVDEPQFPGSTVPPLALATTDIAVVRFHGRNKANWYRRDAGVEQRFNYFYEQAELAEWVPKIKDLASQTRQVHVLMNNCYQDNAVHNAKDIAQMLSLPPIIVEEQQRLL